MEIDKSKVLRDGVEVMTMAEFARTIGNGVSTQAIAYGIAKDKLDFVWIGSERLIMVNEKARSYVPNNHPTRETHRETLELGKK